jgi:hypothetical protein
MLYDAVAVALFVVSRCDEYVKVKEALARVPFYAEHYSSFIGLVERGASF